MNILIIQRQSVPQIELIEELSKKARILSIFFTSESVKLATKKADASLQKELVLLSKKANFNLLVCGRAFDLHDFKQDDLAEDFTLSGNMELSTLMVKAQKTLEF